MSDTEKNILTQLTELKSIVLNQSILQKDVLSFDEAVIYLNLSESYLYKLTSKKEIPYFCPHGKMLKFNRLELDKWQQRNPRATMEEINRKAATYVSIKKYLKTK